MAYEKVWEEIEFFSNDLKTAAYLYKPKDWSPGDPPRPGITAVSYTHLTLPTIHLV